MRDIEMTLVEPLVARLAGVGLLSAAAGLSIYLAHGLLGLATDEQLRRQFNSSSLLTALILLVLCLTSGQAGYRLAFNRPDRTGTLFSRWGWVALGTAFSGVAALMAFEIVAARTPTLIDGGVIVTLAAFGVWCFVLARRGRGGGSEQGGPEQELPP